MNAETRIGYVYHRPEQLRDLVPMDRSAVFFSCVIIPVASGIHTRAEQSGSEIAFMHGLRY